MTLGLNLHDIARQAIAGVHPEKPACLYRSVGQETVSGGEVKARYALGQNVSVQMQNEGPTALFHADRVGQEEITRKFYLFSGSDLSERVAGIVRPLSRNGDMLKLIEDNTWWLIEAVLEDFSGSGWVSVRATMQVRVPDFTISEGAQP